MATDDSNDVKVKMIELRGEPARAFLKKLQAEAGAEVKEIPKEDAKELMERLGLDFTPQPKEGERPWTRRRMTTAFGDFLDDHIAAFVTDMSHQGMKPEDIFHALQASIAHNLGAVERARAFLHDSVNGKEGPRDEDFHLKVQALTQENIHIGWDHKNSHLKNPDFECLDPYKLGEADEDSPAKA